MTARIRKDNGHCNKIHRAHGKERVGFGHDRLAVYYDCFPCIIQRAVFMHYSLWVTCCSGSIGDIAEIMKPDLFKPLQGRTAEDLRNAVLFHKQLAMRILSYVFRPFGIVLCL